MTDTETAPSVSLVDTLVACLFFAAGFLFWEWKILQQDSAGIGASLYFIILLAITFVYLQWRGIKQTATSFVFLIFSVLGALPFVLNGSRDIHMLLLFFECCICLLWVALSCRTTIAPYLSGFLIWDLINQTLIIPFANYGRGFISIIESSRLSRKRGNRFAITLVYASLGILIALPVLILAFVLLINSDAAFFTLAKNLFKHIRLDSFGTYLLELVFGIPIGCYIFGAVYGNAAKRHTRVLEYKSLDKVFHEVHILPRPALYAPLCCLVLIYLMYFFAMGPYLFSALSGRLPEAYTYAEYARHGFFELCAVAFINLLILGFAYLFARRSPRQFPVVLRVLTGSVSLLSCLLVVTAMSKMALYIDSYGLSSLRTYTFWFMVLLMVVFVMTCVWHLRPFNVGRPLIVVSMLLVLAFGLANTDGIIARYNVDRYLKGRSEVIDIEMLTHLSDGALPALYDLRDGACDYMVREQARCALSEHDRDDLIRARDHETRHDWFRWNIQRLLVKKRAAQPEI